MYTNAQSLLEHKDEILHQVMKERSPVIVALSGMRVDENIEDFEINIRGYSHVRCDVENRYTRGVVVYIRNDIIYETVMVKKIIGNCWCIVIKVKWYRGKMI